MTHRGWRGWVTGFAKVREVGKSLEGLLTMMAQASTLVLSHLQHSREDHGTHFPCVLPRGAFVQVIKCNPIELPSLLGIHHLSVHLGCGLALDRSHGFIIIE